MLLPQPFEKDSRSDAAQTVVMWCLALFFTGLFALVAGMPYLDYAHADWGRAMLGRPPTHASHALCV